MATLAELARTYTGLDGPELAHLQRLVGTWGMLADLCFADMLLLTPADRLNRSAFVVLGQMRPTTSQTLYREDLVGGLIEEVDRPLVARAWRQGTIMEGEVNVASRGELARLQCIPVRSGGRMVGVLTRESAVSVGGRRPGELERIYIEVFDRLAKMISRGEFPFASDEADTEEAPRVGDGVLVLDDKARVSYASPNAINALHRMGITANAEGATLGELGIEESVVVAAFSVAGPASEEITTGQGVIVLARCIPLLDGAAVTGAVVLMRDITDVRRRDRLLLSKDAAIREVHHRVKNNLQTISSLLRLQSRRLSPGEGQEALDEAVRRISSIALVHEILSRDTGEEVEFADILGPLKRMAEESMVAEDRHVRIGVAGDAGRLPAALATPLAVVLSELLQNAVEHAFAGDRKGEPAMVWVNLSHEGDMLEVRVSDNGRGLPPGFSIQRTRSLGLSIVREFVTSQLAGEIEMWTEAGTRVELRIPIKPGEELI
jgi:two-component sensor histidine kinase